MTSSRVSSTWVRRRVAAEGPPGEHVAEVAVAERRASAPRRSIGPLAAPARAVASACWTAGRQRDDAGGGEEHDAGDALVEHVGVVGAELHERHAAHRVADDDRVAQVERLEHRAQVGGEQVQPEARRRPPSRSRGRAGRRR